MPSLFLLSRAQMRCIKPLFPKPRSLPRVNDRRVISGIVYVIRNGLQWKDAPRAYGPHKTLYNRFVRWSRRGVFERILAALAGQAGAPDRLMIDTTHLKAHRTAASLQQKRLCCMSSVVSLFDDPACIATPQDWRAAPPPSALTRRAPRQLGF